METTEDICLLESAIRSCSLAVQKVSSVSYEHRCQYGCVWRPCVIGVIFGDSVTYITTMHNFVILASPNQFDFDTTALDMNQ